MIDVKVNGEKDINTIGYPKLMIESHDRFIDLFTTSDTGTVVKSGGGRLSRSVGYVSVCWGKDCFIDFHGSITLENRK